MKLYAKCIFSLVLDLQNNDFNVIPKNKIKDFSKHTKCNKYTFSLKNFIFYLFFI